MLLLSTSSLKWYWLHKIFSFAKKANYDWIDLVIERLNYDTWDEEYIKSLSDSFWVPVLSITAPDKSLDKQKIDKIITIASTLQTQSITFSPPHITDKWMEWFYKYLAKIKRDTRKSIAVQNIEQKFLLFVIPEYKNANLTEIKKITWDTALNIANVDKSSWLDLLQTQTRLWNTITNVYLSDRNWPKDWLIPWSSGWWISYLPLESFLMKLRSAWYRWYFSLKVRPMELWAWNDEKVLQNLEYVKNYYKKHFLDFKW